LSDRLSDLLKERGPSRFGFVKKSGGLVRKVPGIPDSENAEPKGKQERRKKQSQLDKLQDQVASDSDREPITGKTEAVNRSWREKKDWASEDYFDEIQSFVVRSDESRDRSVDALWLTGSCYGAHANLLPRLRQTAILRNREIKRGMLTDLEPVRSFVAQDVYVLIATFSVGSGRAPFLWETERIRKTTYLRRADPSGTPAPPMEFLDSRLASYVVFNEKRIFKGLSNFRAFHPVVMVFPTRQPDGSPLIRGVDDSVELHTEVDGRPVRLTFNLKHFDLRSVDDLKPGSSPNAEASTGTN
jgi:hypothetical protein